MGMTHREQELTQAKDMLQIKLERLEKDVDTILKGIWLINKQLEEEKE